jgi:tRNA G18 (ribose-2'-O)-methylase SpoU
LTVVLDNIRSSHNVGSIFRTCDGAGVEKLWLCGITCYPPNPRLGKTALGAEDHVPWEHAGDVREVVRRHKGRGYQVVVLEQTDQSRLYGDFIPAGPLCLVAGNETGGVDEEVVGLADAAVEIEMRGVKNSLNVAVASGLVIYDFCRKLEGARADARIRYR